MHDAEAEWYWNVVRVAMGAPRPTATWLPVTLDEMHVAAATPRGSVRTYKDRLALRLRCGRGR